MKVCSRCGETKQATEFYRNKKHPDGLFYECKVCTNSYSMARYEREKVKPEFMENKRAKANERYRRICLTKNN